MNPFSIQPEGDPGAQDGALQSPLVLSAKVHRFTIHHSPFTKETTAPRGAPLWLAARGGVLPGFSKAMGVTVEN